MTDSACPTQPRLPKIANPAEWVVWLDLDDTLWDFRGNSHESLIELFDHLKLNRFWKSPDEWIEHYHRVNSSLWDQYAKGTITRDTLRHDRFFNPFTEAGMNAEEAERLVPEADRYYLERLGLRGKLVSGAKELVDRLRQRGFRLGILSNGFKEVQYNKLRSSGLDELIDIVVLSDEIDINKPDVRLYRHA
ncbi:MAG: HAD hydrolase-like protein, partial [Muribaculaceae bacterium]|nr:HAD hydrolase-like protein [Muribaculaceae bacterium]